MEADFVVLKTIPDSVEKDKGEWRSVRGLAAEKKRYARYAVSTLRKDRRVDIRISGKDPDALRNRAAAKPAGNRVFVESASINTYLSISSGVFSQKRSPSKAEVQAPARSELIAYRIPVQ